MATFGRNSGSAVLDGRVARWGAMVHSRAKSGRFDFFASVRAQDSTLRQGERDFESEDSTRLRLPVGRWDVELIGDWHLIDRGRQRTFQAGGWIGGPELVVAVDAEQWTLRADPFGLATVFVKSDQAASGSMQHLLSTRFKDVASASDAINANAIEETSLLGHCLGESTSRVGIGRLGYGETLRGGIDGSLTRERTDPIGSMGGNGDSLCRWKELLDSVDSWNVGEYAAIELTGGLDSRLILGLMLASGNPPREAITFGDQNDSDCKVASALCSELGIKHRVIPMSLNDEFILDLSSFHAAQAGGLIDISNYARLLPGLRSLASVRDVQIGGTGGECAIDFYSHPLADSLTAKSDFRSVIRNRIIRIPPSLRKEAGDRSLEAARRIEQRILAILDGYEERDPWHKLRRFYLLERVRNWASLGLNANRYEYRPIAPLLGNQYLAWAMSLSSAERRGRIGQEDLLSQVVLRNRRLLPLLRVPFSAPRRGIRRFAALSFKFLNLLRGIDPRAGGDVTGLRMLWDEAADFSACASPHAIPRLFGIDYEMGPESRLGGANSLFAGVLLCAEMAVGCPSRSSPPFAVLWPDPWRR